MANPKAEAAYIRAHFEAAELADRIHELLFDMPAPEQDEIPINWDHVGSVEHVNAILRQAVSFMEGRG